MNGLVCTVHLLPFPKNRGAKNMTKYERFKCKKMCLLKKERNMFRNIKFQRITYKV